MVRSGEGRGSGKGPPAFGFGGRQGAGDKSPGGLEQGPGGGGGDGTARYFEMPRCPCVEVEPLSP